MDKLLKPTKLSVDPNSATASKEWRHWIKTFKGYVRRFVTAGTSEEVDQDTLAALISCATAEVYEYFDHCETF